MAYFSSATTVKVYAFPDKALLSQSGVVWNWLVSEQGKVTKTELHPNTLRLINKHFLLKRLLDEYIRSDALKKYQLNTHQYDNPLNKSAELVSNNIVL